MENKKNNNDIKYCIQGAYYELGCSFWSTDFDLTQNFQHKLKIINNNYKNEKEEENKTEMKNKIEKLGKYYDYLTNEKVYI